MKNVWLLCAAMAALGATSAAAADLPVKATPIVTPVYNWTGFYVGASGGWIWNDTDQSVNVTGPAGSTAAQNAIARSFGFGNTYSWLVGGQAGYNLQMNPAWVFGVEADISGMDISSSNSITNLVPVVGAGSQDLTTTTSRRLDWLGTARARIGWAGINNLLFYGTGGLAYGGGNTTIGVASMSGVGGAPFSLVSRDSSIRVGWTAGAGIEMAVSPNWTFKWEALYYDLGKDHVTVSQTVTPIFTASSNPEFTGALVRVGLNYKFGTAPLVAKY